MQVKGMFISIVLFLGLGVGSFIALTFTSPYRANQTSNIIESKTEFKSDLLSVEKILQLKIPSAQAPVTEWQDFFGIVKRMKVRNKRGNFESQLHSTSPKIGLLAIMAKRAPAELINQLENKQLSHYAFRHLLESGLLANWDQYSKEPERIMLENSQALFAVALNQTNQTQLRRRLADTFLAFSGPLKLDMSSLAFALPTMGPDEVELAFLKLLSSEVDYDPRSVIKLESTNLFSPSQLAKLVDHKAYAKKNMSSYQFDATYWGEHKYLKSMARDVSNNAKQPMNFYCAICTLAAFTDGLVGHRLSLSVESGTLQVTPSNDAWVFDTPEVGE